MQQPVGRHHPWSHFHQASLIPQPHKMFSTTTQHLKWQCSTHCGEPGELEISKVTGPQGPPLPPMVMVPPPPCGVVWWCGGCQSLMLYIGYMNKYKAFLSVCRSKKGSMKRFLHCNSVAKHLLPAVVVMCYWHSFEGRREGRRKEGKKREGRREVLLP